MARIGRRQPVIPQPPEEGFVDRPQIDVYQGPTYGTVSQSPDTRARVNRAQGSPYSIDVPDPYPDEPTTTTQKIGNQLITTTTQNIRGGVEEDLGQQTFIYGEGGLDEIMWDYGTDSGFGPDYMADSIMMQGQQPGLPGLSGGGSPAPEQPGLEGHWSEEIQKVNQILTGLYWLEMEEAQGY